MQKLAIVLALITVGCIVTPIGTVAIMYRNNPSQMVIPPQLQQMMHFGNNNNSNQNGNNYNNNNNNPNNNNYNSNNVNNNNNNNNANNNFNSGDVNNNNSPVANPTNSFGGSYQFDVSIPYNGRQIEDGMSTNINCLVEQNGNNIQLSLDLAPTSVPSDLQSIFSFGNDYVFNFVGTTTSTTSGTQINANAQGGFDSGNTFDLNLSGSIDQSQNTLTFTLTSAQDSQVSITTPQAVNIYFNGNNNTNNSNNNNDGTSNSSNNGNNNNGNNNDNTGVNPSFVSGQIDTTKMKITLTFSVTNSLSQSTTINAMSGTIAITDDQYTLGTGSLQNAPVTIPQGQTTSLTVSGTLTQDGKNSLLSHYGSQTYVDVEAISGSFTEDGVTNQQSGTQDIGTVTIIK